MKTIKDANKNNPCPHCGKPDWCYSFLNGATVCNRGSIALGWIDSGKTDKNGSAILYPEQWAGKLPQPKVIYTQEWIYNNRQDQPLVKVIRQDLDNGKKKIFQNYLLDGKVFKTRPKSISREDIPVYRLSEVKKALEANEIIFIVEGEKCADLLWSLGLAATTNIQGCKSFSQSDIQDFGQNPRIVLVPDRDQPGIKLMQQWNRFFPEAQWLYPFPQKDWSSVPPDNGVDIYDWITDYSLSKEAILKAIGVIPDSLKVEVKTSKPLKEPQGYDEDDDDEQFSDGKGKTYLDPAMPFTEKARQDIFSDGHYVSLYNEIYKFNGQYYVQCDRAEEEAKIIEWAHQNPVKTKNGRYVSSHLMPDHIDKIWNWTIKCFKVKQELINPKGINLKNGRLVIEWRNGQAFPVVHPHTPDVIYTYCSGVSYDPNADPTYCDRLLECLSPIDQIIFLRSIALSLDLAEFRKKIGRTRALFLEGTGNNGKDSLRLVVKQIFGNFLADYSLTNFDDWEKGDKGTLEDLTYSLISWASENSEVPKIEKLNGLKRAISGEELRLKPKYEKEQPIEINTVFLFNINGAPRLDGALEAIKSRFCIIRFNKTFSNDPNPEYGELKADPRFKYDPQWVLDQVAPSFLRRILEQIPLIIQDGIPYKDLDGNFDEIRRKSNHLWEFVDDAGIVEDKEGKIYLSSLWGCLKQWYIENGTLEIIEYDNGKPKSNWNDQARRFDRTVKAENQLFYAFQVLFPKISKQRETMDANNKGRFYVSGISFSNIASPASLPDTARVTASPTASLCFTTPSLLEEGEGEDKLSGEAVGASSEAVVKQLVKLQPAHSEAVKQVKQFDSNLIEQGSNGGDRPEPPAAEMSIAPDPTRDRPKQFFDPPPPGKDPLDHFVKQYADRVADRVNEQINSDRSDPSLGEMSIARRTLFEDLTAWRDVFGWSVQEMRAFAKEALGIEDARQASDAQLHALDKHLSEKFYTRGGDK